MSAYILSVCGVTNMTDDFKKYIGLSAALVKEAGGTYLVRGKNAENVEGSGLDGKVVILISFPSMEQLKGFVYGEKYQNEVKHLRDNTGIYDIAIFESPPPGPG